MIARALSLLLLLLLARPTAAQDVRVLSGEHEDFSRLVFLVPGRAEWTLREGSDAYVLEVQDPGLRYRLGSVFTYIPKTRITAVEQVPGTSNIRIETTAETTVETFELQSGAVVIDVKDAPARPPLPPPPAGARSYRPAPKGNDMLAVFWRDRAPASVAAPGPVQATGPDLSAPDARVTQAEAALLEQIGRAAAQGLIRIEKPNLPTFDLPINTTEPATSPAEPDDAKATHPLDHLALRSETAIDRDARMFGERLPLSDRGIRCAADRDFDLGTWRGDSTPAELIGLNRRDLLGEFDRPRPGAVVDLVKSYLSIGFGVEALAVLRSYPLDNEEAERLEFIASVLEGRKIGPDSPYLAMTDCDGKVALWALIGSTDTPAPGTVRLGAVQLAFAALPPEIRALTGQRLVDRLIEIGASDIAKAIRATLARASGDNASTVAIIDAKLAQASGDDAKVDTHLEGLLSSNSQDAATALIALVENKIRAGRPVDDATIEQAAALAHELGASADGSAAIRAHVLSLGSVGRFDEAFVAFENWKPDAQRTLRSQTLVDLYGQIAKVPDDGLLLNTYFSHRAQAQQADLPRETRRDLALRLIDLGFSGAAREVLGADARLYEQGRILLARAALAERDGPAALAYLSDLESQDASQLRGQALQILGEHSSALNEFDKAQTADRVREEAWRSGDWDRILKDGSDQQKALLTTYGIAGKSEPESGIDEAPEEGPLARANKLIAQSAAERKALEDLLSQYPIEDPPAVEPAPGL